jgi:hypothetical protein
MADILYIDCNRQNSIKSDENTNEWEFKLHDEALVLPKGTQVSIQESFINKKGIGGNTIVLEEDIKTTIKYCYYINHSPQFAPNTYLQPGAQQGSFDLFSPMLYPTGWQPVMNVRPRDFDDNIIETTPPYVVANNPLAGLTAHGGFEKPLVAVKITDYTNNHWDFNTNPTGQKFPIRRAPDNDQPTENPRIAKANRTGGTIEPMIGTTTIFIPKGSYSVDEVASLIEDQLTGRLTNVENKDFNENFIQKKVLDRTYNGTLENDGTTIMTTCLPHQLFKSDDTARDRTDILNYREPPEFPADPNNPVIQSSPFEVPYYGELGTNAENYVERKPDNSQDRFRPLFFMVPSAWNDCRETFLRNKEWNDGDFSPVDRVAEPPVAPDTDLKIEQYIKRSEVWDYWQCSQDLEGYNREKHRNATNQKILFHIWRNNDFNNQNAIPPVPSIEQYVYTPQDNGVYIGAPELEFKWNQESSAFEFNNLHFPYRFPSHDQRGDIIPEAGNEGVLFRKVAEEERYRQVGGVKTLVDDRDLSALETPMGSNGGIAVFNWGEEVAQKYGDIDRTDTDKYAQTPQAQNMWSFEEYFSSKEKAIDAWKHTLWHRLGFTYDQLQNRDGWTQSNFSNEVPSNNTRLFGATTRPEINTSIIPTISSTYNNVVLNAGSEKDIRPRIFGNFDTSRSFEKLDTTAKEDPFPGLTPNPLAPYNNALAYTNSLFPHSTCAPVQTRGRPLTGQLLPTLSTAGYYLITSDIIDGYKDRIKRGTPISLLGVVPISNLSSQDFIQNKNTITHTIQNTSVINSVKIKILKPDLTNPILEENSSVILKIVRPIEVTELHTGDVEHRSEKDIKSHAK